MKITLCHLNKWWNIQINRIEINDDDMEKSKKKGCWRVERSEILTKHSRMVVVKENLENKLQKNWRQKNCVIWLQTRSLFTLNQTHFVVAILLKKNFCCCYWNRISAFLCFRITTNFFFLHNFYHCDPFC